MEANDDLGTGDSTLEDDVYQGTSIQTGDPAAIKLEPFKSRHTQLLYEARLYKIMNSGDSVGGHPNVRWECDTGTFSILII